MLPLCRDQGIGVIPWSPLARGRLAAAVGRDDRPVGATTRSARRLYTETSDRVVVDARRRDRRRARRADGPGRDGVDAVEAGITAPIIGATKPHHLDDAVAAVELALTDDEIARLEEPYTPHPVAGF